MAARARGRAVKWIIHPALCAPVFDALSVPPVVIWLERDYRQQARSQLKLVGIEQERGAERALARSILRDTPPIRATMRRRARAIYTMGFAIGLVETLASRRIFWGIIAGHFDRSFDAETAACRDFARSSFAASPGDGKHIAPMIAAELGLWTAASPYCKMRGPAARDFRPGLSRDAPGSART